MRPAAAILALHARRVVALLQETRLIDDQHRVRTVQLFQRITPHPVPHLIGIPPCPVQQVLDRIGSPFAHPLSQLPTVLALATTQQTL